MDFVTFDLSLKMYENRRMRDTHLELVREEKLKKVINIAQAVFIVTENAKSYTVNDMENTDIKKRVLNDLELATLNLIHTYYKHLKDWETDMSRGLVYMRTLISLAQQIEIISSMNAQVLEKGINFVFVALEEKIQDTKRQDAAIAETDSNRQVELAIDLNIDNVYETETFDIYQKDTIGEITDKSVEKTIEKNVEKFVEKKSSYTKPVDDKQNIKDTKKDIKQDRIQDRIQDTAQTRPVSRETESHNRQQNRRQEILDILTDTPISIKDISTHILGCSEKTIQRELNALLFERRIQKIGEKRWSKYLLR